jgi:Ca-activated chloride channel family protein
MQSVPRRLPLRAVRPKFAPRLAAWGLAFWLCASISGFAQSTGFYGGGAIPTFNVGADPIFGQMDFVQMSIDQINRNAKMSEKQKAQDRELVESGVISALDLEAPMGALEEYNRAKTFAQAQHSEEAAKHLQRALKIDPKFVAAHIGLGLAYADQGDTNQAKQEFETAEKLDEKFPGSFLQLGVLELSLKDFGSAQSQLEKAALIHPNDPKILSTLAYAENGNHQYQQAIDTAQRVHALDHKGLAEVHYVAAAAAMSANDFGAMQRELTFFVDEDPTNAFAPAARKNLEALARRAEAQKAGAAAQLTSASAAQTESIPNSDRLKTQLNDVANGTSCDQCEVRADANETAANAEPSSLPQPLTPASSAPTPAAPTRSAAAWTIRATVDDVALFFAVSNHGHMVGDLQLADIQVSDNNKAPVRILQFAPQSKLPLRLALLVDTSGSVNSRFSFEKRAATQFVQKVLSGGSDLAFIAGFSSEPALAQDFTSNPAELGAGIDKLANGGGTALFDAVTYACRKLGEYPDNERVARVLVILSDGEDNSSHRSLKQSIEAAERSGVTIYAVSTKEDRSDKTDADRVLTTLAESSGGEAMFPGDTITLGKSFDRLRDVIRTRYFIAYKPADFQANGSYHTIKLVAEKDGKHLQVRARKGYHARIESSPN